jgi:hypothetical protein
MITIEKIKKHSKSHRFNKKIKICCFGNEYLFFSVTGGDMTHGDFEDYFEVAILDQNSGNFITDYFYSDCNLGVIERMSADDLVSLANTVLNRGYSFFNPS